MQSPVSSFSGLKAFQHVQQSTATKLLCMAIINQYILSTIKISLFG